MILADAATPTADADSDDGSDAWGDDDLYGVLPEVVSSGKKGDSDEDGGMWARSNKHEQTDAHCTSF